MAREFYCGWETRSANTEGAAFTGSGMSFDTAVFRTGLVSLKAVAQSGVSGNHAISGATLTFRRIYIKVSSRPASTARTILGGRLAVGFINLRINPSGTIGYYIQDVLVATSTTALTDSSKWYKIEYCGGTGTNITIMKIDSELVTGTISSAVMVSSVGPNDTFADTYTINFDDLSDDDVGFPGGGNVSLLLPTATNGTPAAKWTDNDGTQTNMWEGVNNTPPTGTAATTTPSHNYIKHAGGAAGTTDEFDATMTTYAASGIGATDTINSIRYIIVTGEESATGTKLLAIKGVSNPVVAQGSSFDVFATSGAQGTYPTNWQIKTNGLALQQNPSVSINSAPVFGVVRPETATRVASVCAMYMYVDYTPASSSTPGSESDSIPAKSSQIVSVNRASFY